MNDDLLVMEDWEELPPRDPRSWEEGPQPVFQHTNHPLLRITWGSSRPWTCHRGETHVDGTGWFPLGFFDHRGCDHDASWNQHVAELGWKDSHRIPVLRMTATKPAEKQDYTVSTSLTFTKYIEDIAERNDWEIYPSTSKMAPWYAPDPADVLVRYLEWVETEGQWFDGYCECPLLSSAWITQEGFHGREETSRTCGKPVSPERWTHRVGAIEWKSSFR